MNKFIKFLPFILASVALNACSSGTSASSTSATTGFTWIGGSNESNASGVYGSLGVAAPSNIPGARDIAVNWVDNAGNFWLFGGGNDESGTNGNLNDLWKYSPSNNEWTWVSGSNTVNATGIYGVQGIADIANAPGARIGGVSFKDPAGNLWLFGGFGYAETEVPGTLNDLWMYSID